LGLASGEIFEELVLLAEFSAPLGQRGRRDQGVATGTELALDVPGSHVAKGTPEGGLPQVSLRCGYR